MQTFLPYSDYRETAKCLDWRRLGKQRVECLQILQALTGQKIGWKNHPAVKMWRGFEGSLVDYSIEICKEWRSRGYKDSCLEKVSAFRGDFGNIAPNWLGEDRFHLGHRSNLIRKFPEHYQKFWPEVPGDLGYVWPV